MIKSYKDLIVWQKSFALTLKVYKVTVGFPKSEIWGLTSQIQRAAVSVPSNVAEGYARQSLAEYTHFLKIAFGSGAELETQLLIVREINLIDQKRFDEINTLLGEVMRMLNSLIGKLKVKKSTT